MKCHLCPKEKTRWTLGHFLCRALHIDDLVCFSDNRQENRLLGKCKLFVSHLNQGLRHDICLISYSTGFSGQGIWLKPIALKLLFCQGKTMIRPGSDKKKCWRVSFLLINGLIKRNVGEWVSFLLMSLQLPSQVSSRSRVNNLRIDYEWLAVKLDVNNTFKTKQALTIKKSWNHGWWLEENWHHVLGDDDQFEG